MAALNQKRLRATDLQHPSARSDPCYAPDIDIGDPKTGKPGNPGGDGMLIWVGIAASMTY